MMKIIATNIGKVTEINYKGKIVKTGIYKKSVVSGIFLGTEDVDDDHVVDRRFHGGVDKACYLYSADFYTYWKALYPNLEWEYGMFGENLTVKGLNEQEIFVGNQYKIGEAKVEISQPRQPCFKFGHKMGDSGILKQFINTTFSGIYVRVLQKGMVKPEDKMQLLVEKSNNPTIAEVFYCLYQPELKRSVLNKIIDCKELAESSRKQIKGRLG
ncbi:MOSC domain-containing protein [Aquimarina agarivorans]|uniref:MOSC domain-containing protein n=1 Tax=Aquimarina agarivorans TaxID=980584 RepID=UPI001EE659D2|nr:MOSC domain-containing protein [Aquimarina agarivorans]